MHVAWVVGYSLTKDGNYGNVIGSFRIYGTA